MPITIDKAGRVVIPAELRRKAGLSAGTPLAATYEDGAIQIRRDVPAPKLRQRGSRLIAKPSLKTTATEPLDLAACIEEERNRWPT